MRARFVCWRRGYHWWETNDGGDTFRCPECGKRRATVITHVWWPTWLTYMQLDRSPDLRGYIVLDRDFMRLRVLCAPYWCAPLWLVYWARRTCWRLLVFVVRWANRRGFLDREPGVRITPSTLREWRRRARERRHNG